ncbi:hypothetical protein U1555_19945, partial [Aeromonas caviae]|uniref:hypothetical protein n=1 Tax=Aeromonas caviae TaxID=648 RepID=UPI003014611D
QQGDGGGVFGDSQFTSTLSVNFHFPKIPRRTFFYAAAKETTSPPTLPPTAIAAPIPPLRLTTAILNQRLPYR